MDTSFQEFIVRWNQDPRYYFKPSTFTHQAEGYNRLCGDELHIYTTLSSGCFEHGGFTGECCAMAKASAALLLQLLKLQSQNEFKEMHEDFKAIIFNHKKSTRYPDLNIFAPVHTMPSRYSCALLPWRTLEAALQKHHHVQI